MAATWDDEAVYFSAPGEPAVSRGVPTMGPPALRTVKSRDPRQGDEVTAPRGSKSAAQGYGIAVRLRALS